MGLILPVLVRASVEAFDLIVTLPVMFSGNEMVVGLILGGS